MTRVQETSTGILVYSIICIFLWPSNSRGALDTASHKLLATQHRLYRAYRGLMAGQGTLGDARPLEMQEAQLLPQLGQAVSAARTESYEVWEVRHQWRSLQQQALTLAWADPRALARDNPQAGILVRDLLEDVRAWRLKMQALFQALSRDPTAKTADELSEQLAETLQHMEERIEETVNKLGKGEVSALDSEHFYRLLGAYRGVSEALVDITGNTNAIDSGRWHEARF